MYSPKIWPDQIAKLYRLKVSLLAGGKKGVTMTDLVREALTEYLAKKEKELRKNGTGSLLIGEPTDREIVAENRK